MTRGPVTDANLTRCFSDSYLQAHSRFHQQARLDDSRYLTYNHPLRGPANEPLRMAIAWQGDPAADKVLVTISGTHGVEGFAGSAVQLDQLHRVRQTGLPMDVAVMHIHAFNPHGFAWLRRVNEQGVDLNRNFVDFGQTLPDNPLYDRLADSLVPAGSADRAAADQRLDEERRRLGDSEFYNTVTAGQYTHSDGLYYGGHAASWSARQLEAIYKRFDLDQRQCLAVVDLHTGLGPWAAGEVICDHAPGSQGVTRARRWFGDRVTEPALGSSSSGPKTGLLDYAWQGHFGDRVCFVTLEFGTYGLDEMLNVLRNDHILHKNETHPDMLSREATAIKQAILNHFCPSSLEWRRAVLLRADEVIQQAIAGLEQEPV